MVVPTMATIRKGRPPNTLTIGSLVIAMLVTIFLLSEEFFLKRYDTASVANSSPQKFPTRPAMVAFDGPIEENPHREQKCRDAVDHLVELGIHLIALDFDLTTVDLHTGGRWKGGSEALVKHVRRPVKCLMRAALQNKDIHVAIASFSKQTDLITEVLQQVFPHSHQQIVVRGGLNTPDIWGKRKQLDQAVHMTKKMANDKRVSDSSTLLIDDDSTNVQIAKEDGYWALWLDPDNSGAVLQSIAGLHRKNEPSHSKTTV